MTTFFLVVDLAAVAAHRSATSLRLTALLGAGLIAGIALGAIAIARLDEARLRRAIPPIVLISACAALARVLG